MNEMRRSQQRQQHKTFCRVAVASETYQLVMEMGIGQSAHRFKVKKICRLSAVRLT